MKELDLQQNPSGNFRMRVSIFMGKNKKRKRIKIGLGTRDYMEAQARAILFLRLLRRFGLYERHIPMKPKKQGPEITADLPLFAEQNRQKNHEADRTDPSANNS